MCFISPLPCCLPVKGGTLMLIVWLLVKSDIVDIFDVEMAPSGGGDPFMLGDIFVSWIIHHGRQISCNQDIPWIQRVNEPRYHQVASIIGVRIQFPCVISIAITIIIKVK